LFNFGTAEKNMNALSCANVSWEIAHRFSRSVSNVDHFTGKGIDK